MPPYAHWLVAAPLIDALASCMSPATRLAPESSSLYWRARAAFLECVERPPPLAEDSDARHRISEAAMSVVGALEGCLRGPAADIAPRSRRGYDPDGIPEISSQALLGSGSGSGSPSRGAQTSGGGLPGRGLAEGRARGGMREGVAGQERTGGTGGDGEGFFARGRSDGQGGAVDTPHGERGANGGDPIEAEGAVEVRVVPRSVSHFQYWAFRGRKTIGVGGALWGLAAAGGTVPLPCERTPVGDAARVHGRFAQETIILDRVIEALTGSRWQLSDEPLRTLLRLLGSLALSPPDYVADVGARTRIAMRCTAWLRAMSSGVTLGGSATNGPHVDPERLASLALPCLTEVCSSALQRLSQLGAGEPVPEGWVSVALDMLRAVMSVSPTKRAVSALPLANAHLEAVGGALSARGTDTHILAIVPGVVSACGGAWWSCPGDVRDREALREALRRALAVMLLGEEAIPKEGFPHAP